MEVVGDVHTHPGAPIQSGLDRDHPMIAQRGHIALIVPFFAQGDFSPQALGIYEYASERRWEDRSLQGGRYFYVGRWG